MLERWNEFRRDYMWPYIFIAPTLILLGIFLFYPLVHAAIISMQDMTIAIDQEVHFVGLDNYIHTLQHPTWRRALFNTVVWTIGTVSTGIIISLLLAWLIFPLPTSAQNFFKAAYYLPSHIGGIMVALVWWWMFQPLGGLLNYIVGLAGIARQNWLMDARTTLGISHGLLSMMLVPILGGHGGGVILYLAAMGNIPTTLYEAADIDAANGWRKFTRITWPLLRPTTLYVLITSTIGSFQVFELVYVMTRGGPVLGTVTLVYQVYVEAFERTWFGVASAQAFILAAIVVTLSLVQFRLMSTDVEY